MKVNEALKYAKASDYGDGDSYVIDALKALAAEVKRLRTPRPMSEPRVWVGESGPCPRVYCVHEASVREPTIWDWCESLDRFDIFVPHSAGKPTIDLADMKSIETCSEIDWLPDTEAG